MDIKTRKINLLRDVGPLVEIVEEVTMTKEEMKLYIEDAVKQGGTVLIAEEAAKRIGFIIVRLQGEAIKGNVTAYMDLIYIIKRDSKNKIKEALMKAAKQWCEWRRITLTEIK
ncbi:MAG: hypothetical protein JJT76_08310 [Clostridiaceae bacterium]|nr:hypothetical protein [Clostridiaceae bacterium]